MRSTGTPTGRTSAPLGVVVAATVVPLVLVAALFAWQARDTLGAAVSGEQLPETGTGAARSGDGGYEFTLSPAHSGPDRSADTDRNIVEIVADDMRVDDLLYAPKLRRLIAAQGIEMRNAFSSYPLCCPARASFFSGQESHNHGVFNVKPPYGYRAFDDRRTIATALQEAGYRTGLVGKYLNAYGGDAPLAPRLEAGGGMGRSVGSPALPMSSQYYVPHGWDEWRASLDGARCKPICGGTYSYFNYAYSDNGTPTAAGQGAYSTTVIGQQSRELARQFHNERLRSGDPFFLSVNYVAPHNGPGRAGSRTLFPYRSSRGDAGELGAPGVPKRVLRLPQFQAITSGSGLLRNGRSEGDVSDKPGRPGRAAVFSPSKRRALTQVARQRAAAIHLMDKQIGRLIGQLKKDGEWGRTVVVFWSDNGYYQGEHNRAEGKIDPYEPVLRIPMLITGPGMRDGSDRYDPMTVTDLTATLLDVADARAPHTPDGVSMLPVIRNGDRGWDRAVLTEAATSPIEPGTVRRFRDDSRTSIGVRTPRYLYLRHRSGALEIYDLVRDPDQWHNRAAEPRWLRRNRTTVRLLEQTWRRIADCAGPRGCSPLLPAQLRADAAGNAAQTRGYFAYLKRAYGPGQGLA